MSDFQFPSFFSTVPDTAAIIGKFAGDTGVLEKSSLVPLFKELTLAASPDADQVDSKAKELALRCYSALDVEESGAVNKETLTMFLEYPTIPVSKVNVFAVAFRGADVEMTGLEGKDSLDSENLLATFQEFVTSNLSLSGYTADEQSLIAKEMALVAHSCLAKEDNDIPAAELAAFVKDPFIDSKKTNIFSMLLKGAKMPDLDPQSFKYDADGDGIISKDELAVVFEDLLSAEGIGMSTFETSYYAKEMAKQAYSVIDVNHDGRVDLNELKDFLEHPFIPKIESSFFDVLDGQAIDLDAVVAKYDVDNNGVIDEGELAALFTDLLMQDQIKSMREHLGSLEGTSTYNMKEEVDNIPAKAREMAVLAYSTMDINHDGVVDLLELKRFLAVPYVAREKIKQLKNYVETHDDSIISDVDNTLVNKEYKNAFDFFDTDKSKSVDVKELKTMVQSLGHIISDAEVQALLASYDKNQNGTLDFVEFCALMDSFAKPTDAYQTALSQAFDTLDTNKSGMLEWNEIKKLLTAQGSGTISNDQVNEFITKFDINGDGKISKDEFVKALMPVNIWDVNEEVGLLA